MGILVASVRPEEADGPGQSCQGFPGYGGIGEVRQTDLTRSREQNVAHGFVDRPVDGETLLSHGYDPPSC